MSDGFNETPVRGKRTHNQSPPDGTAVGALVALAGAGAPALIEGNVVYLSTDLAGNLRVTLSDPNGFDVDVTDRAGRQVGVVSLDAATLAAQAATQTAVRDALLAGLESVSLNADTRDDLVTRLTASISNLRDTLSTNLEAVSLNADTRDDIVTRLTAAITDLRNTLSTNLESVDLNGATVTALNENTQRLRVRGAEVSDTNPLPVNVEVNPGTLVDSGLLSSVDVAPGATVTLDSAVIGAGVSGRLVELTAASSVRIKVVLRRMGTGAADQRVFFVDPTSSSLVYKPVDRDAVTAAAGGRFRISITNMDNLRTADVYGSLTHVEF